MRTLAIVPARGGSKGIKDKNIAPVNGIPLIDYTLNFARDHHLIDDVVISTDSAKITKHCQASGFQVIERPSELAQDSSLVIEAIKYTLNTLKKVGKEYDCVFLLEPTSPLRSSEIVIKAYSALHEGYTSAATFSKIDPPPSRLWKMEGSKMLPLLPTLSPFIRRQEHSAGYKLTGQLYAFTPKFILESKLSVISDNMFPIIYEGLTVDIDEPVDLVLTEKLLEYYENK